MTTTEQPATEQALSTVGHWIDGALVASTSGRTAPVYDPALGVATKQVALADAAVALAAALSNVGGQRGRTIRGAGSCAVRCVRWARRTRRTAR